MVLGCGVPSPKVVFTPHFLRIMVDVMESVVPCLKSVIGGK